MAVAPAEYLYTAEEYLALERQADFKSEYVDGRIYAMSGAREAHDLIAGNVFAEIHNQLKRRPCVAHTSDFRLGIGHDRKFVYPDVSVVCGQPEFRDNVFDTLLNPALIVEVLSESTALGDRGWKATAYRAIPSLQEYILIAQDRIHVEHYIRNGAVWIFCEDESPDAILEMPAIGCSVAFSDIYDRVTFPEEVTPEGDAESA